MATDNERLTQAVEILYEIRVALVELLDEVRRQTWACGCGHINGANLLVCAQCNRRPGDSR